MHHIEEREADYKASRSLCWVTENLGDWSAKTLSALFQKFKVHGAIGLGGSSPSCQIPCSQGQMKCSILVELKERWEVNLDSRLILLPPWYLFWCFCQPLQLQLSCRITHSLGSPKCFSIPGVSDGWWRTICHLKCNFWSSEEEMFLLYEKLKLFILKRKIKSFKYGTDSLV